jgi:hypothetical protein
MKERHLHNAGGLQDGRDPRSFIDEAISAISQQIGAERAVCGLSGGVDSSVAAVLVHKAIGANLTCIFVDNGLLRKGEAEGVENVFRGHYHMNLVVVDAKERFLKKLEGVVDPEAKRKIIGAEFIRVFEEESEKLGNVPYLVQGTLLPDVVESVSSQKFPENATLADLKRMINSHISGELCPECREALETELGQMLFYIAALCAITGLDLDEIMMKEHDRLRMLGLFNLT